MKLKITANTFFVSRSLAVDREGVEYRETALVGGKRRFRFAEIDCVLLSDGGSLSVQAAGQVIAIPVKGGHRRHEEFIARLAQELEASRRS